jgi:accessory gene regulator protein AgrB
LIFGIKGFIESDNYYIFQINKKGNLSLLKYENGEYENLILTHNKIIEKFN